MKNIMTIIAAIAGCLIAAYFLWPPNTIEFEEEEEAHNHDFLPFNHDLVVANNIQVERASPGKLKHRVRAPAQIAIISDQKAHILPKTSGIAIQAYKNLGESVTAGEVVAFLESTEMAEAKAHYLAALKKSRFAQTKYEREQHLYQINISSAEDYNSAQITFEEALIELELSKQKLYSLGLDFESIKDLPNRSPDNLRTYEIHSPISGKVIARHITPGEFIANDREIYTIADLSSVWAEIHIFAHERPFIQQGQMTKITNDQGQSAEEKVTYLSPIIDEETRTSTAFVKIQNFDEMWLPGTFVEAEFITDEMDVPVLVKKEAIQNIDGVDVLFISAVEGFEVRPVTKGRMDDEQCEIISGLNSDENYACKNAFLLKADLKKDEAEHMD